MKKKSKLAKRVCFAARPEFLGAIETYAETMGMNTSQAVRQLLYESLKRFKKRQKGIDAVWGI